MQIAIAGNANGRGLEKDFRLIKPIVESLGLPVQFIQYDEPHEQKYVFVICLEVISRHLVSLSEFPPILIPNPEWLTPESIKIVQRSYGSILCKTKEAYRICKELFGDKAQYVGFLSEDRFDASVERKNWFVHVAGQSKAKNTDAVINAWRWTRSGERIKAPLFVVSDFPIDDLPDGVHVVSRISDGELKKLQNTCQFHLQPSATEGYGHVLHEAMSVNASILTVDAAPMNEIHAAYKIPSTGSTLFNSVKMHEVSAIDVHKAVQDMLRLGRNGFAAAGMPRKEFLDGNEAFKKAFAEQLKDLGSIPWVGDHWELPRRTNEKCIAFLGNFQAPHSTENELAWSMEFAGYDVVRLQENEVDLQKLKDAFYCDVFWWVRTPGWLRVPDEDMFSFLDHLKAKGIPSVGYHLDRFFGIPDREFLIGRIPFWKCAFCFTADGDNQKSFESKGVNHIYLPPAVALRGCYPGTPKDELRVDVGFVGASTGYHREYPQREQLIEFLKSAYGDRFRIFSGYRGHALNDLYASIRVCVGDSCFANTGNSKHYFSDRIPETLGRFGVLVHPWMEGLSEYEGLVTHAPGDFQDLKTKIDLLLLDESIRRSHRRMGSKYVREKHTYSNRLEHVMMVLGLR